MNYILPAFLYIQMDPHFWASMGFTCAIAMFLGAIIYDGHIANYQKGLVTILTYTGMLIWVNLSRISMFIENLDSVRGPMAFASIATTLSVTSAWIVGLMLGVVVFKKGSKER